MTATSRYLRGGLPTLALLILATSAGAADTCQVTLRASDPLWNRPKDTSATVSSACNASATDSQNDGVPYRIVHIKTTTMESFGAIAVSQELASTGFDPFLALYCGSFNPASPLTNLMAVDDDSAGWPNPQIGTSLHVTLTPNTDYVLVVSAYSNIAGGAAGTALGKVQLSVLGHAAFSQTLAGCCKADFDQNGIVNVSDIFSFLRAWFAHLASADIDTSSTVTVSDIFAFLRTWFAKCP